MMNNKGLQRLPPEIGFLIWGSIAAVFFLSGCSLFYSTPKVEKPKPIYEMSASSLDEEYFYSPADDIKGHYPAGWLQVNTENIPELENILTVYCDPERSSAMVLTEIPGTAELRRKIAMNGILAL